MALKILILLFIFVTTVFGKKGKTIVVDVDQYHTCLPIMTRMPYTTNLPGVRTAIYGDPFTATRHHVIPFSTLTRFYNLVLQEDERQSPLGRYLARRVRDIYDFFEENDEAGAFLDGWEPVTLDSPRPITVAGRITTFNVDYRMMAAFTWLPGNIFYGPSRERRSDDPGENFEDGAGRIVGNEELATLRRIYDNMQNYINCPSERTITNFNNILEDLNDVGLIRKKPYEFNQKDWDISKRKNEKGEELYYLKRGTEVIEELTTHRHDELRKKRDHTGKSAVATFISSITDSSMPEDYLDAALEVCNEVFKPLIANLNPNITSVDIDTNVDVIFVYSINKKYFIYGQSRETKRWFIKEVEPNGRVGKITDQGTWKYYYAVNFPFKIEGKQYFYAQNLKERNWFVQELKEGGKMGRETAYNTWEYSYLAQYPININDKQYFYGQCMQNKYWFLQELNADGTMGRVVSDGNWERSYNIQFTFKIGDKQYIGGHNTETKLYFIRDIASDNLQSMGRPNTWDYLDNSYPVLFPFSFGGKTYIFGHNPEQRKWFLDQLLGPVVEVNSVDFAFDIAHPFNINGAQYFYAKNKNDSRWSLVNFVLKFK